MPDKSCRICGGELISHLVCSECRKPTQRMCSMCNKMTMQEYHQNCLNIASLKTENRMKIDIHTIGKSDIKPINTDFTKLSSRYEIYS